MLCIVICLVVCIGSFYCFDLPSVAKQGGKLYHVFDGSRRFANMSDSCYCLDGRRAEHLHIRAGSCIGASSYDSEVFAGSNIAVAGSVGTVIVECGDCGIVGAKGPWVEIVCNGTDGGKCRREWTRRWSGDGPNQLCRNMPVEGPPGRRYSCVAMPGSGSLSVPSDGAPGTLGGITRAGGIPNPVVAMGDHSRWLGVGQAVHCTHVWA